MDLHLKLVHKFNFTKRIIIVIIMILLLFFGLCEATLAVISDASRDSDTSQLWKSTVICMDVS